MNPITTKDLDYYMALRYAILIRPEEDGWSATIPDLKGCLAVGDTIQEALDLLEDAKHSWITASISHQLPIPKPSSNS